jgi:hybrid cluster-associated redox disulfide protein
MAKEKITKDMLIAEVVNKYPETVKVFFKQGMSCVGCAVAHLETIEQGAEAHGMDLKKLMKDLNKALEKKK